MYHIGQRIICVDDRFMWAKTMCSTPPSPCAALIFRLRGSATLARREYCLKKLSTRHARTVRARSSHHFSRGIFGHSPIERLTSRYSRRC